jgi:hypothetical protein
MCFRASWCIASTLALAGLALAQSSTNSVPRHGPLFGTFSSLHFISESGDLVGNEVTVLPQMSFPFVIFQCSEGAPNEPAFVPARIEKNRLTFTIKQNDNPCNGVYTATANSTAMLLKGPYGTESLPRRKSYWSR